MDRKVWRDFDLILLAATVLLIGLGIAMIYSATINTPGLEDLTSRQITYALIGLGLMFAVAAIDYRLLESFQKPIYFLMLASLALVFLVGEITHGSRRWIGAKSFQPSELAKVLIVVVLAKYLADRAEKMGRLHHILLSLIYVIPPMLLIYFQPDLGTSVVIAVIWLAMIVAAGVPLLHLGLLGVAGALSVPLIWVRLEDYMRMRVITFLDPGRDPLGTGYNINQALIAIGSGSWLGQGFASGSQSQLHFLRVRHTDFVFSVLAEELGFAGAMILFGLLILLLWRILRAASLSRDTFGYLIAWGMATIIFFQGVVSIGMNLGLMPTTGIPLPFICSGGSSLITFLIGLGLVQSVVMRHRKLDFQ